MGKRKDCKLRQITPEEQLKYEVAEELGLLDKVMNDGWKALSAKETGRIGGLVTKRKREMRNMAEEQVLNRKSKQEIYQKI